MLHLYYLLPHFLVYIHLLYYRHIEVPIQKMLLFYPLESPYLLLHFLIPHFLLLQLLYWPISFHHNCTIVYLYYFHLLFSILYLHHHNILVSFLFLNLGYLLCQFHYSPTLIEYNHLENLPHHLIGIDHFLLHLQILFVPLLLLQLIHLHLIQKL